MPAKVERRLQARARRLHLRGERRRAYVFGTLARIRKARRTARRGKRRR